MRHIEKQSTTEYYEFTEDEMRKKLGLPADFRILIIQGTGPFRVYRFHG
jgi:hypothetical protein